MVRATGKQRVAGLSAVEIQGFRTLLHQLCGLALPDEKLYLLQQRLEPLVKRNGCRDLGDFLFRLTRGDSSQMREQVISAITTPETSFFRDEHPFTTLQLVVFPWLQTLIRARKEQAILSGRMLNQPVCRIWCAGVATGQEAYSLAMTFCEYIWNRNDPSLGAKDISILATDISTSALVRASAGRYTPEEVEKGVSPARLNRFFERDGDVWRVSSDVRHLIEFQKSNLIDSYSLLGPFDMVFCRNVMIYFDKEARDGIVNHLYDVMSPEGFLLLGSSETLLGHQARFTSSHHGKTILYRKLPVVRSLKQTA
jgi:chemotaxis protein methyltransferase CheR